MVGEFGAGQPAKRFVFKVWYRQRAQDFKTVMELNTTLADALYSLALVIGRPFLLPSPHELEGFQRGGLFDVDPRKFPHQGMFGRFK